MQIFMYLLGHCLDKKAGKANDKQSPIQLYLYMFTMLYCDSTCSLSPWILLQIIQKVSANDIILYLIND